MIFKCTQTFSITAGVPVAGLADIEKAYLGMCIPSAMRMPAFESKPLTQTLD
jgi:hypothetical protein